MLRSKDIELQTGQKTRPYNVLPTRAHLTVKDIYKLKVRGWEKIFHANGQDRKAGVAILISDKIDFKMKAIKKDKEGHYLMIKGSIQEEDITIVFIFITLGGGSK